jgi:dTDP-4-dehydrorhamnose reductase
MSKLTGEFVAKTVSSTILRTNFVGRSMRQGRTSFTDWLYAALRSNTQINVFEDILFSPLSMSTLCKYIEQSVVKRPIGVFNLGSGDGMSKADFAFAFALATRQLTTNMVRINSTSLTKLAAPRPTDMRMDCKLFEERMNLKLPSLIDEIKVLAYEYI